MYHNRRPIPNERTARLIVTTARLAIAHFKSAADRIKALSKLDLAKHAQAGTPPGLAALVKAKAVDERYINRLLIKAGGMSRAVPPRSPNLRKPESLVFGKPFLAADNGSVKLHRIIQANPKGFRHPSTKAKKWFSTSLMERVTGVVLMPTRSARGDLKAVEDATYRTRARLLQDDRRVPAKYLNRHQRARVAAMPPLPLDDDAVAAILADVPNAVKAAVNGSLSAAA